MTMMKENPPGLKSNFKLIPVGKNHFAIVDPWRYEALMKFRWDAVKSPFKIYAKSTFFKDGKWIKISMHRFISKTPTGQVCHHLNGRTLDNRKQNLANMTKRDHTALHHNNNILIKYSSFPAGH